MVLRYLLLLPLLLAALWTASTWAQVPAGDEGRINVYTTESQTEAAVAADPTGRFLVVWRSDGQDGDGPGIFGRHFDAAGTPGPEHPIDTHTIGNQTQPDVAAGNDGRFLVVWRGPGPGDDQGVFGRRIDAQGVPQGQSFLVNNVTPQTQTRPTVDTGAGQSVVAWRSVGEVKARRFDASGVAVGLEFLVGSPAGGDLSPVAVDVAETDGRFTVAWADGGTNVDARRFAADGSPLGPAFAVSGVDPDGFLITGPQVESDGQGRSLLTWATVEAFENVVTEGRSMDAAGILGPAMELVPFAANTPNAGRLSMVPSGDFMVVWSEYSSDYFQWSLEASRFDAGGTVQETVTLAPNGREPVIAQRRQSDVRDFVVVWYEYGANYHDVRGRLFQAPRLFEDGFESGDTSAWSTTVP